ncbi:hypothetical protein [Romboutsia sp. 1001216sp1]|uniref:hypothetical protein n=1 Tax=Romboutsia sp. 1001216sp1 TaxID=2986997 RepID=UPI00232C2FB2|nr:hypothetical protein [Romboutsia sp. 1001216sp1]MDB8803654.1 hypothetical protein [Romboutsia sp. 1001216sp1]MDB8807844.1 hypothetical protein [Romboutsia sp. 1001216sp1]MDB8809301.1 hypothetical protein [Romboutsia sp. 1001216sp1]MDB8815050.1 hypothetical protein [Romboutsia sp. 1001216sp1]MDB8817743.1 hypothetical protein [Romboutsia sp. 1001216sp1]
MRKITDFIKKKEKEVNLPFGSDECGKFLKETYKDTLNEVVVLDDGLYEKIEKYNSIVDNINKLEKEKKIIEHIIQSEMREYETAFCKDKKITWKKVIKNSIDTKRLKIDYPEIIKNYTKTSTSRTFRMK